MQLLIATSNPGKFAEVQAFLAAFPLQIVPLTGFAGYPEIIEDGSTFEENALKKAETLARYSGLATLADDSGLEVDALGGAPGIYSARYAGAGADDGENNRKLLAELRSVPERERGARFVCALAFYAPRSAGGKQWIVRETCEGRIVFRPRGENGFGYDPVFLYPPLGKTFGELDRATKVSLSHRGKALRRFGEALPGLLGTAGQSC